MKARKEMHGIFSWTGDMCKIYHVAVNESFFTVPLYLEEMGGLQIHRNQIRSQHLRSYLLHFLVDGINIVKDNKIT